LRAGRPLHRPHAAPARQRLSAPRPRRPLPRAEGRAAIETERSQALAATNEVREEIDRLTKELGSLTDAAHREEVARAEQRMRLEALAERAMSELGLELDPLVEEYGPHMLVPELIEDADNASDPGSTTDRDAAQASAGGSDHLGRPYVRSEQEKRLAKASRDLARLGKVNPLALEEHAALEQRHQFLAEQLADLKRSRDDLLSIVEEIDARVQEVFAQAYEDTARQFASVFDRLFPGGEGRLVLTDPDDMLTTGIEIEARPADKKVKRLSLLSGGELIGKNLQQAIRQPARYSSTGNSAVSSTGSLQPGQRNLKYERLTVTHLLLRCVLGGFTIRCVQSTVGPLQRRNFTGTP